MVDIIEPHVLLISNKLDFTTDHVAFQLNRLGVPYLRLNRDQFAEMQLELRPTHPRLSGRTSSLAFDIRPDVLKSVYFRAPTFLRENSASEPSPDEQLSRSQWAAFLRGLTVFDTALWINHPKATYQAEVKPFQLRVARSVGFNVPDTLITNSVDATDLPERDDKVIAKTLDTIVLQFGQREGFIYTNTVPLEEFRSSHVAIAPVILQQPLLPKLDIRVTVVGANVSAVAITSESGEGFSDDWRKNKDHLQYSSITLPSETERHCIELVKRLDLVFAGIDLVQVGDVFYFLEANPTGEWAWLLQHVDQPIDAQIASLLVQGC